MSCVDCYITAGQVSPAQMPCTAASIISIANHIVYVPVQEIYSFLLKYSNKATTH